MNTVLLGFSLEVLVNLRTNLQYYVYSICRYSGGALAIDSVSGTVSNANNLRDLDLEKTHSLSHGWLKERRDKLLSRFKKHFRYDIFNVWIVRIESSHVSKDSIRMSCRCATCVSFWGLTGNVMLQLKDKREREELNLIFRALEAS